ncbi:hypothetical protein DESC_90012 [Desulfosarcina cetonica]|nr:hypothetical protein DESC_90012 [Desulfosarcina cetonica]
MNIEIIAIFYLKIFHIIGAIVVVKNIIKHLSLLHLWIS